MNGGLGQQRRQEKNPQVFIHIVKGRAGGIKNQGIFFG